MGLAVVATNKGGTCNTGAGTVLLSSEFGPEFGGTALSDAANRADPWLIH